MTSEIRTNSLKSRAGLSTVTLTDSGPMFSGITTFVDNSTFSVGTGGTIHAPATNTLNIGVNNTESLRIDSNSNLKVAGIVTATHFYGNGANLTGLPAGTTINNQSDNRMITCTGTSDTLNAEQYLTYTSQSSLNLTDGVGTSNLGGNYLLLKRTTGNTNYINAPLANAELVISADEDIIFRTVHTADFNSTERLRIDSSGRIDILGDSGNAGFTLSNAYGQAGIYGGMYYNGSSWIRNAIGSRKGAGMYVNTGGHIEFFKSPETSGTSATVSASVRITNEGYIHLGNTSHGTNKVGGQGITGLDYDPYFKLYASTANHWLMQLRSDTTSGNGIFLRSGNSSSNYTLYATGYDENNAHFLVRGDGVVSLGAKYTQGGANPQLSMYGSSGRQFKIMNSGSQTTSMQLQNSTTGYGEDAGIQIALLGGGIGYVTNQYAGNYAWEIYQKQSNGSQKHIMRVYRDGKIGHQTDSDNLMLSNSQDGSGSNYFLRGSKNSTTPGGGNDCVWIYEDGDIRNNNNSYGQQSDIKLKENVVDANSQWDDIKKLKVRNFNFKASTGFDTHTQIGLIAQEAELVSPGLVKEVKDRVKTEEISEVNGSKSYKESLSETEKTKHVMYSVLYMKAIKALQEAMTRIETLEQDNITLRARVTNLEGE